MRAGGADREEFIAAARKQHGILAHMSAEHAAIGKITERDALREIGPGRLGLLAHGRLDIMGNPSQSGNPGGGKRKTRRTA